MSAQEETTTATILNLPTAAEKTQAWLDEMNDVVRQMDENDERWRALEAEFPQKAPLSPKAEEERRRRQASRALEDLGRRNIWYRKDASGISPADRYFAKKEEGS